MKFLFSFLFIAFLASACSNVKDAPDVSAINVDLSISRFDKDFFSIDTNNVSQGITLLQQKYPSFLPIYFEYFSPIDFIVRQQDKNYEEALREYFSFIKPLYDSVEKSITSIEKIEKNLEKNLKYVKHYFPSFKIPAVLTTVESLNPENPYEIYGTTYYHDTLIISLQMFLGKDFSVYDPTKYPEYLRRRFTAEFIVPNSIRSIANELYADSSQGAPLIEQMIEKGKQWFLLSRFLPEAPDSLITGYSRQQMEWIKNNEGDIWAKINQSENLFSIEPTTIQTYLGESPFTQTLPHNTNGEGAPGNLGPWIGWRILETYAANNPKKTLQQLLKTPARRIFQEAKYKPK